MGKTGLLTQEELQDIIKDKKIKVMLETGTYLGDSTLEGSKMFEHVHTIEIVPELREQAIEKCKDRDNITFHLGDTVKLLPNIVDEIREPCLWFLDAHQSGPETSNNGEEWVPLLKELAAILEHMNRDVDNVFTIDDVRLFSKHWDWEGVSIKSIEECFRVHGVEIKYRRIKNDRFTVYV